MITLLEWKSTFIGYWFGRIHGRQALYALIPVLVFLELVLPTECLKPRNNPGPYSQRRVAAVNAEGLLVVSLGPFLLFFFLAAITLFPLPSKAPLRIL